MHFASGAWGMDSGTIRCVLFSTALSTRVERQLYSEAYDVFSCTTMRFVSGQLSCQFCFVFPTSVVYVEHATAAGCTAALPSETWRAPNPANLLVAKFWPLDLVAQL